MTKALRLAGTVFLFFVSCASPPQKQPSIIDSAHPDLIRKPGVETVVILGTNDLHGNIGQLSLLSSYIQHLRNDLDSRLIWLDAGSHFQGTLVSDEEKGASITNFFNELGLHAAVLGAHEFDFGLETLSERIKQSKFYYLSANLKQEMPLVEKHILINAGKIKVGVIGLTTSEAVIPALLSFQESKKIVLKEARALRAKGAQIVVLMTDMGVHCSEGRAPIHLIHKHNETLGGCHYKAQLPQLLKYIGKGVVDAVVSGNTHTIVHHWIGGVPVIQSGSFGNQLHAIYMFYDTHKKKLLADKSFIEGPIPVQEGFVFHGQSMQKDPNMELFLKPQLDKIEESKNAVIGKAGRAIPDVSRIAADALMSATQSDYAVVSQGLFQKHIPVGALSMDEIYEVIPYASTYATAKISGSALQSIMRKNKNGRSRAVLSNSKPIFRNKIYKVAMPDFIAKTAQIPPDRIEWQKEPIRDALVQYIKNNPHLLR
jgi:2',3'-cyclic-nucleotide 2'-phosphodiesterase (5'-nucleotidase family)